MSSSFGPTTEAHEVVRAFADRVKDRVFLITGTSAGGLGANVAITLAREASPAQLILVSRNRAKCDTVMQEIASVNPSVRVTFVAAELSDFDSVRAAAAQINDDAEIPHIDVIINNAGIMALQKYQLDRQGIEMQFSTNHLGHFLLANLVMPKLLASKSGARIVNVTSEGSRVGPVRFDDYNFSNGKTYEMWTAYGQSKTANILHAVELARRLADRGVTAYSVPPGLILETGLGTHLDAFDPDAIIEVSRINNGEATWSPPTPRTLSQGTAPLLCAALNPAFDAEGKSGSHIGDDCQVGTAMPYAVDAENARKLWELSEKLVGQKFNL